MPKHIAILGIGNDFRGDDSLGLRAVRQAHTHFATQVSTEDSLNQRFFCNDETAKTPSVTTIESPGEVTQILDCFENHDAVFIIDAVNADSLAPGEIVRIDLGEKNSLFQLENISAGTSTHSFSLKQIIDLAQALNTLPRKLIIFGIAGQNFSTSEEIDPRITASIEEVLSLVKKEIATMTRSTV